MKKYLQINWLIIVALVVVAGMFSSCKLPRVVEKSEKHRPDWVYGINKDYVIIEGVGSTWDEAQENALAKLKERIVSSVAVNISSEMNMQVTETVFDNMSKYSENTELSTNISSDFLNSLKGISLNKVDEFYWEKQLLKDKKQMIHYHIKYPFSSRELDDLIREWERTDKGFTAELDALGGRVDNTVNVDELYRLHSKAIALKEIFTGPRKTRASILESEITQHINNLKFEVQKHDRGQLILKLLSTDRYFEMNSDIIFEAQCAVMQDAKLIDDDFAIEINYDGDFCYSKDKAEFNIQQTYGGRSVLSNYLVPAGENSVRLTVNNPIRVQSPSAYSHDQKWYIPIRVFTDKAFVVKKVELVVTHNSKINIRQAIGGSDKESYIIKEINQKFNGKGDFSLQFEAPISNLTKHRPLVNLIINEATSYSAAGKIYIQVEGSEIEYVFEFYNKNVVKIN